MQKVLMPFSAVLKYRELTFELAKRDVLGRYRGASFGLLWSLISPFLLLCVYTFAFGTVMKNKWPQAQGGQTHFSIILFAGMIVHGFFAECLNKSPVLISGNPNFVKRVIFPLDILPWPMVLSALFHTLMNAVVFIVLRFFMDGAFTWQIILLPIVFLPLFILTLGVSWFLASMGVYLRDIGQVTGVLSMALLFLSSAMMPIASVPPAYHLIFTLNPLSFIIDQARNVMLWGIYPDWIGLALYALGSTIFAYAGYAWFMATRKGFADVL
jgi:lipopolysaccharide transport system permease protein